MRLTYNTQHKESNPPPRKIAFFLFYPSHADRSLGPYPPARINRHPRILIHTVYLYGIPVATRHKDIPPVRGYGEIARMLSRRATNGYRHYPHLPRCQPSPSGLSPPYGRTEHRQASAGIIRRESHAPLRVRHNGTRGRAKGPVMPSHGRRHLERM